VFINTILTENKLASYLTGFGGLRFWTTLNTVHSRPEWCGPQRARFERCYWEVLRWRPTSDWIPTVRHSWLWRRHGWAPLRDWRAPRNPTSSRRSFAATPSNWNKTNCKLFQVISVFYTMCRPI